VSIEKSLTQMYSIGKNIIDGDMKVCSFVNVWNGNEE
jgi:hypothetical protein